jgi:hypothetical protein
MRNRILNAYRQFMAKDRYLLEVEANERSLTHRFAIHVEAEFPGFHVDCEYNRNGLHPKRLVDFKQPVDSDDEKGVTVFPDIIVHHRGPAVENNLIVIEAKASKNHQDCQNNNQCPCDFCKLRAYKANLGYQHAFFIIFPVDNDLENYSEAKLADYVVEVQ